MTIQYTRSELRKLLKDAAEDLVASCLREDKVEAIRQAGERVRSLLWHFDCKVEDNAVGLFRKPQ